MDLMKGNTKPTHCWLRRCKLTFDMLKVLKLLKYIVVIASLPAGHFVPNSPHNGKLKNVLLQSSRQPMAVVRPKNVSNVHVN